MGHTAIQLREASLSPHTRDRYKASRLKTPIVIHDASLGEPGAELLQNDDFTFVVEALDLPKSTLAQAIDNTSKSILVKLKDLLRSKKTVFLALSSLMLMVGLIFANDVKHAVGIQAAILKQDIKNTFATVDLESEDPACVTYAKYIEDQVRDDGDLTALLRMPGLATRYLQAKAGKPRSCRDLLPPNFITLTNQTTPKRVAPELNTPALSSGAEANDSSSTPVLVDAPIEIEEELESEAFFAVTYEEDFLQLTQPLSSEQMMMFEKIDSYQSAIDFFSTITLHQLIKEVAHNLSTGIETISYRLPETIRGNTFLDVIIGMTEKTYRNEGLPEHTVAVLYRFSKETQGYLGPAVYVGTVDYSQKYFGIDAQISLAVSTEAREDTVDKMLAHFYIEDRKDTQNKEEPFKTGNRIFGLEGSSFFSGAISTHSLYLCSDRDTGNWWITDWFNVPRDNPNIDAAQLMWNWHNSENEFEVDQVFLASQQLAELNNTIEAIKNGKTRTLVGPSVAFRTSDDSRLLTDAFFFAPYSYLHNPELLGAIFEDSPHANGNKPVSTRIGSPDLHYTTNGWFPILNQNMHLSQLPGIKGVVDSVRQSVLSSYHNQSNSVGFSLVIRNNFADH